MNCAATAILAVVFEKSALVRQRKPWSVLIIELANPHFRWSRLSRSRLRQSPFVQASPPCPGAHELRSYRLVSALVRLNADPNTCRGLSALGACEQAPGRSMRVQFVGSKPNPITKTRCAFASQFADCSSFGPRTAGTVLIELLAARIDSVSCVPPWLPYR